MDQERADAINEIYDAAESFDEFSHRNIEIVEAFHEYNPLDIDDVFPAYRVHVVIEDPDDWETFTYPVAEYGREQGLFLFDTVTKWEEEQIILRFGYPTEDQ